MCVSIRSFVCKENLLFSYYLDPLLLMTFVQTLRGRRVSFFFSFFPFRLS